MLFLKRFGFREMAGVARTFASNRTVVNAVRRGLNDGDRKVELLSILEFDLLQLETNQNFSASDIATALHHVNIAKMSEDDGMGDNDGMGERAETTFELKVHVNDAGGLPPGTRFKLQQTQTRFEMLRMSDWKIFVVHIDTRQEEPHAHVGLIFTTALNEIGKTYQTAVATDNDEQLHTISFTRPDNAYTVRCGDLKYITGPYAQIAHPDVPLFNLQQGDCVHVRAKAWMSQKTGGFATMEPEGSDMTLIFESYGSLPADVLTKKVLHAFIDDCNEVHEELAFPPGEEDGYGNELVRIAKRGEFETDYTILDNCQYLAHALTDYINNDDGADVIAGNLPRQPDGEFIIRVCNCRSDEAEQFVKNALLSCVLELKTLESNITYSPSVANDEREHCDSSDFLVTTDEDFEHSILFEDLGGRWWCSCCHKKYVLISLPSVEPRMFSLEYATKQHQIATTGDGDFNLNLVEAFCQPERDDVDMNQRFLVNKRDSWSCGQNSKCDCDYDSSFNKVHAPVTLPVGPLQ